MNVLSRFPVFEVLQISRFLLSFFSEFKKDHILYFVLYEMRLFLNWFIQPHDAQEIRSKVMIVDGKMLSNSAVNIHLDDSRE